MKKLGMIVAGLMGLAAMGCGGSGNTCQDAMAVYCARACECGETECRFEQGGTTISFDTYDECFAFFGTLGCSQPRAGSVDWAGCEAAVNGAACVSTAVPVVSACEIPE